MGFFGFFGWVFLGGFFNANPDLNIGPCQVLSYQKMKKEKWKYNTILFHFLRRYTSKLREKTLALYRDYMHI